MRHAQARTPANPERFALLRSLRFRQQAARTRVKAAILTSRRTPVVYDITVATGKALGAGALGCIEMEPSRIARAELFHRN